MIPIFTSLDICDAYPYCKHELGEAGLGNTGLAQGADSLKGRIP